MSGQILSVKEFLEKIAAPRGITVANIEAQLKSELDGGKDFEMHVGAESELFTIPNAAIKEYFDAKIVKPKATAPVDEEALKKMLSFEPTADDIQKRIAGEKATAAPVKEAKVGK